MSTWIIFLLQYMSICLGFWLGGKGLNRQADRIVVQSHQRSYDDPITLSPGNHVNITKRDLWDGQYEWLWCSNDVGKEGWVPASYLDIQNTEGYAIRDYSALELTAAEGETVMIVEEESGWYWCENATGQRGWVPTSCFKPLR